ncbi:methyltransferase domain-containing protein, partial [Candidatus Poribacteria bacterium]|nr:methyltransferase domain-containing protein [Candidatus Poribacteria bacterium]
MNKIAKLKRKFSRNPFLKFISGCPYRSAEYDKQVARMIRELGPESRILDLGSGSRRRAEKIMNLEIAPMPNVDLVADGHWLPFKDGVFDAVIIEAVLEHVREPKMVVSEIYRVLKTDGRVYA